ncbi:transcriptional regulator [Raoultella sp. BIGb0399]|uniref:winged helix-turn-helix domain-containing protein n=1 Tax=Raoultella sp. BIGb0399 TaxID=2485119 RepID=UPI000F932244|nr:hypothetical protein [Raoultella sp. BIGb0399]ROS10816.1 transcriptional regulator [Raoultella sp. BIGb0399]
MDDIDYFVIGENIIFIPTKRLIIDGVNRKEIKLQVPASMCFEKLLKKQGEVISQNELIDFGWGEKRKSGVSTNAYYQSILHLRKNLENVGLFDIIDTIPRNGLRINKKIKVSCVYLSESASAEGSDDLYHRPASAVIADLRVKSQPEPEQNNAAVDVTVATTVATRRESPLPFVRDIHQSKGVTRTEFINTASKKWRKQAPFMALAVTLLPIFVYFWPAQNDGVFSDYIKLNSKKCAIYAADNKHSLSEIQGLMDKSGLPCTSQSKTFFTASPMGTRINFISCTTYDEHTQNCRSLTIMKDIKVKP